LQTRYWRFFWPLSVTGLVMLLARQFQNGAVARYPDSTHELAVYALATSVFGFFNACLIFVPQMANVFARSRRGCRVCLRFVVALALLFTLPPAALAFTRRGNGLLGRIFGLDDAGVTEVVLYLRYLLPLVLLNGLRQYYTGLLVQARRTATVTVLHTVALGIVIGMLVLGFQAGWSAARTLASAMVLSALVHLVLCYAMKLRYVRLPERAEHENLTYREMFSFYWPVAMTSAMFALSRPILYSFVNRTPDGEASIAALRVGFDFAMIFHNPLNQFRHLFVTFGIRDLPNIRRFMIRVVVGTTVLMGLVAFTPLVTIILRDLLGVEGEVLTMSRQVIWVLCLVPLVVSMRNYFHGVAMVRRRTGSMAAGAICRVVVIYGVAWGLQASGMLSYLAAAGVLVLGFLAETIIVVVSTSGGDASSLSEASLDD
jgi:progressive ankylosis protein